MDNTTTPLNQNTDPVTPTEPVAPPPDTEPETPPETSETPPTPPVVSDHKSKSKGLKAVLLIVVGLLLLVGVAGAVYMSQQQKIDDLNTQLDAAQAGKDDSPDEAPAQSTNPDLTKSTQLAKDFYAEYNKDASTGGGNADKIISKYGNSNLAFYKKYYNFGFDPIVCGQDVLSDGYTVTGSKSANGVATVQVKDNGEPITVRVVDQGGLKVDGVTCPGEAGNAEPHPAGN